MANNGENKDAPVDSEQEQPDDTEETTTDSNETESNVSSDESEDVTQNDENKQTDDTGESAADSTQPDADTSDAEAEQTDEPEQTGTESETEQGDETESESAAETDGTQENQKDDERQTEAPDSDDTDPQGASDDGSDASGTNPETPADTNGSVAEDGNNLPPYRRPSGGGPNEANDAPDLPDEGPLLGILAFFDHPERTLEAARATRDSKYEAFDVYTPFPVHGMDEAMGLGRSWIPWVTFVAGLIGFLCANAMQFGMMTFDWPMIIGGKPFAPWPSFVPIMFELTVLIGGVTTGVVMLKAVGCFQAPMILDRDLTDDRFAVWITADDPKFDEDEVRQFFREQDPTEIRGITDGEPRVE